MGTNAAAKLETEDHEGEAGASVKPSTSTKASKRPKKLSRKKINQLIIDHREHGKRLAWSFLSSWRIRMNPDEVISVVGAALCEAANRFDPSKEVAFKTFFFYHLRGLLLKEISRVIQEQKLLQLAPSTTISDGAIGDAAQLATWTYPLVENNNPERIIEKRQVASACWEACAQLDPLEQEVLIRFFVYDEPLVSIAKELKYCRCHISRVKSRALAKMGRILKEASEQEATEEEDEDLLIPNPNSVEARRRNRYTGGRGRRRQKGVKQKSETLKKLLAEAY
ncbi:MAG: sigma-70 family RNA polymerase sigma factor [Bdellovibrionales bacterium]|nr:sigma-70 family RNA polymerase sigma factor [Bdellovibrionales bacterium]